MSLFFSKIPKRADASLPLKCCFCRLVTDNAFPPGQVLRNIAEWKQWVL